MPIAKTTLSFDCFFQFLFYTAFSILKINVCFTILKAINRKKIKNECLALKTSKNVGYLSNLFSMKCAYVSSIVTEVNHKVETQQILKINFALTLMGYQRKIVTFIKKMRWPMEHL